MLDLHHTSERIANGVSYQIAIKEHIDAWNKARVPALFEKEPVDTGIPYIGAYLAGLAEYEASLIGVDPPLWITQDKYTLKHPKFFGGPGSRSVGLIETPGPFRKRLIFTGQTFAR